MAETQRCMPETIRITPNIATSSTSPSPPKKLAAVRVSRTGAIGLVVGQTFLIVGAKLLDVVVHQRRLAGPDYGQIGEFLDVALAASRGQP